LSENGGGLSTTNRGEGTLTFGEGQVEADSRLHQLTPLSLPREDFHVNSYRKRKKPKYVQP
ncbi:hypothetical protein DKP78_23825, partial [Enterococcus faecium]